MSGLDGCFACNLPLLLVDNECASWQSTRRFHKSYVFLRSMPVWSRRCMPPEPPQKHWLQDPVPQIPTIPTGFRFLTTPPCRDMRCGGTCRCWRLASGALQLLAPCCVHGSGPEKPGRRNASWKNSTASCGMLGPATDLLYFFWGR